MPTSHVGLHWRISPLHHQHCSGVAGCQSLWHVRSSVDVQDLAGNRIGIFGSENTAVRATLVGRQHLAAEWDGARHLDQLAIGVAVARLGGVGRARRDGV